LFRAAPIELGVVTRPLDVLIWNIFLLVLLELAVSLFRDLRGELAVQSDTFAVTVKILDDSQLVVTRQLEEGKERAQG